MSDVHGHIDNLFQLLKKLNYTQDDILVIVGDLIEKGPDSLRTLRYIMELSERENVYISMGNVDLHRYEILTGMSEEADQYFLKHVKWVQEEQEERPGRKGWIRSCVSDTTAPAGNLLHRPLFCGNTMGNSA